MTRYGMVIDTKLCFGCGTCAVACKVSNNLPKNVWYNRIHTEGGDFDDSAAGTFPNLTMRYIPVTCQHCSTPACVVACPTGASYKDEETGLVLINSEECIGCKSCIAACPYEGVRTHIDVAPAFYTDFALGDVSAPKHKAGVVEKCNYCRSMVKRGDVPACMQLCPGRARTWGDLDDPSSPASKALAGRQYMRLKESAGTNPNTYYLI